MVPLRLHGKVEKGWGHEFIFETNDKYCGKVLHFDYAGAKSSMHFHLEKDETWYVISGSFIVRWIQTEDATPCSIVLEKGDAWRNLPGVPHQLESLERYSTIIEVSTPDSCDDNYRIAPGDSQSSREI